MVEVSYMYYILLTDWLRGLGGRDDKTRDGVIAKCSL